MVSCRCLAVGRNIPETPPPGGAIIYQKHAKKLSWTFLAITWEISTQKYIEAFFNQAGLCAGHDDASPCQLAYLHCQ